MKVSIERYPSYGDNAEEVTEDRQRAADFLEILLNDRIEPLLEWAHRAMSDTSGRLIKRVWADSHVHEATGENE